MRKSPGNSAVRWRKLGRIHDAVVVKLGKDSRKVEPVRVGDEASASWLVDCVESIDSGS